MLDGMLLIALSNSVCLLAWSRSGRRLLALLLCAGLIASCCAMFSVDARRQDARTYLPGIKKSPQKQQFGKRNSLKKKTKRSKASQQAMKEGAVQVGALRCQRGGMELAEEGRRKQEKIYVHLIRFLIHSEELHPMADTPLGRRGQNYNP